MLKGIAEEATYFYHPDHLGSVSVVSNHKGGPYERVEYLPFGEVWIEENDPATSYIPFRFTSKELDKESGLYYYGARYYEPKLSRWMSADPAGWELINPMDVDGEPVPDGWPDGFGPGPSVGMRPGYSVIEATNWYAYVSNNPVRYVDPTGEWRTKEERQEDKAAKKAEKKAKKANRKRKNSSKGNPSSGGDFSSSDGSSSGGSSHNSQMADTMTWTALYVELTAIAGVGILRKNPPMFGAGITRVRFENEEGDAFMADYWFPLAREETKVIGLTASAAVSAGILQADFSTEDSHEYIAESYKGIFHNTGVSASVLSAQYVSGEDRKWQGGELGGSYGKGMTVGRIGFRYKLLGTRPIPE